MTFVIVWSSFTALQHSCIIYCCVLGGMCVHFKFPGLARMLNLYCIFVYSVIDPSGINILGWSSELFIACFLAGKVLGTTAFGSFPFSVYISPLLSRPCVVVLLMMFSWVWYLKSVLRISVKSCLFFSAGMRGHAESLASGFRRLLWYIYAWHVDITLVVAGCRRFVFVCVVLCYVCSVVFLDKLV